VANHIMFISAEN